MDPELVKKIKIHMQDPKNRKAALRYMASMIKNGGVHYLCTALRYYLMDTFEIDLEEIFVRYSYPTTNGIGISELIPELIHPNTTKKYYNPTVWTYYLKDLYGDLDGQEIRLKHINNALNLLENGTKESLV